MKHISILALIIMSVLLNGCQKAETEQPFARRVDKFADLQILRYQVPGFEKLSLNQKKLIYYLSQAALSGRDIIFDQHGKYGLAIRRTLEAIVLSYKGDRQTPEFQQVLVYAKRVWFSNGIYHHYASDKFTPEFPESYFRTLVRESDAALLPLENGQKVNDLLNLIVPVMFDQSILPKMVCQEPDKDLVKNSAVHFYDGVSEKEAAAFYAAMKNEHDAEPPSYGINSRLVRENGRLTEKVWRCEGLYGPAIKQIVYWLEKAMTVTESEQQKQTIASLISYYTTGNVKTFDEYNILWLKDTASSVDFTNGFIETYSDPLGIKATWEAIVNFKNIEATRRTEIVTANAQWFEDHSPVDPRFKKKEVKGVSAKVITVAQLGGDCYPATPIGINLPNADWIRKSHGSKSVTLDNITHAYDQAAQGNGFPEEFYSTPEEIAMVKAYGCISDNLHTDLHECIGHASGQLLPGVSVEALKNYHSTLEEARADLFALYYMMDPQIIELGLLPHPDAAKAAYLAQITNGLFTQLVRIQPGSDIEEAHMRNRQLIARWCFEKGKPGNVIEQFTKNGKTCFRINDYGQLRVLFGELLKEVQRIKSEGDYAAGKELVERYGVKIDPALHKEARERYAALNIAPYSGFLNPEYTAIEENREIKDVSISYPEDYVGQMLRYSKRYSFLPTWN
ncbi:MAG: dihydrofolate reductase [Ignavibacteriales bacterium]|nr:dihydrofolate reductase [Ignavibacteriales bacterium]